MLDDEIDNKVMKYLETHAKHEPNPVNQPITVNDAKDHMKNLLNTRRLIEACKDSAAGRPCAHRNWVVVGFYREFRAV